MKSKIIISIISFLGLSCVNKTAEREEYFIPEKFRGRVYVIFDVKTGSEVNYNKLDRVYKIGNDGILLTKFKFNEGDNLDINNDVKFYLVGSNDTIRIPAKYDALEAQIMPEDDKIHVFEIHNGKYGNFFYKSFFVDTLSNGKAYSEEYFIENPVKIMNLFKKYNILD